MARKKYLDISELKNSYDSISNLAEKFTKEICNQLQQIIDSNGLKLGFPIQSRVKSWGSIKEKVLNQKLKLSSIEQLQDLIGFRAVFLYTRDLKIVEEAISNTFVLKKKYDTFDRLAENQFGYSSIHFIIQIPNSWLNVPSLSEFGKFSAEIQIRTLAQHIWSEVSHELQYKSKIDVPNDLIRPIYRASALLETVDLEFDRLLVAREKYRNEISTKGEDDLNVDRIERILDEILPPESKDYIEEYAELHRELIRSGIKTTSELREVLVNNLEWAIEEDKRRIKEEKEDAVEHGGPSLPPHEWERVTKGHYFTHIGLTRIILENIKKQIK